MRSLRSLATGLTLLVFLGLTAAWAQRGAITAREPKALDGKVVTVRLLLGVGDTQAQDWSGKVGVDKGEVAGSRGLAVPAAGRGPGDHCLGCRTRATKGAAKKAAAKKKAALQGGGTVPNGVFVQVVAPDDARLSVETEQGNFAVALADLSRWIVAEVSRRQGQGAGGADRGDPLQRPRPGRLPRRRGRRAGMRLGRLRRPPAARGRPRSPRPERPKTFSDFVPNGGGDQVRLLRYAGGKAGDPLDVTATGLDVWRPAVAVDSEARSWWSGPRTGTATGTSTSGRTIPSKATFSEPKRLTKGGGDRYRRRPGHGPGRQGLDGLAELQRGPGRHHAHDAGQPSPPTRISNGPADEWSPAHRDRPERPGPRGLRHVPGGQLRRHAAHPCADGTLGSARAVASSSKFEARPSVAADSQGRVWVAYEERTAHWGKDVGTPAPGEGTDASTQPAPSGSAVSMATACSTPPIPPPARSFALQAMNGFPRIAVDRSGRIWLLYRHRQEGQARGSAAPGSGTRPLLPASPGRSRRSCPRATGCSTTARRSSSPAMGPPWPSMPGTAASHNRATSSITVCTSPP